MADDFYGAFEIDFGPPTAEVEIADRESGSPSKERAPERAAARRAAIMKTILQAIQALIISGSLLSARIAITDSPGRDIHGGDVVIMIIITFFGVLVSMQLQVFPEGVEVSIQGEVDSRQVKRILGKLVGHLIVGTIPLLGVGLEIFLKNHVKHNTFLLKVVRFIQHHRSWYYFAWIAM